MDWQTPEDTVPSAFVTEANRALGARQAAGIRRLARRRRPAATASSPPSATSRSSAAAAPRRHDRLRDLGRARTPTARTRCSCCTPSPATATSSGPPGPGIPPAAGGPESSAPARRSTPTDWFVVAPNMLGGCQGTTGPASLAPDGREWGSRFPFLTIRDQVAAQVALRDALGIDRWAAVIGGSMGGMQALEWAVGAPGSGRARRGPRRARRSRAPTRSPSTRCRSRRSAWTPRFAGGDYYDAADGDGPASRPRPRPTDGAAQLPLPHRAQRPVRAQLAERAQPARAAAACSRSRATSTSTATSSRAASTPTATSCSWMP